MKIYGIEKLSLVDFDGELTCTIFTAGCNLRCPYCHNSSLVIGKNIFEIPKKDIFDFLEKRKNVLTAICVSGGEPTLNSDLPEYLKELRQFNLKLKLDTNGTNPNLIRKILNEGLVDYIAMDIKSAPNGYVKNFGATKELVDNIKESVNILKQGKIPYEFRCTLCEETSNEKEIEQMGQWIAGANKFFFQNFEDVGTNLIENQHPVNQEKTQKYLKIMQRYVKNAKIRG